MKTEYQYLKNNPEEKNQQMYLIGNKWISSPSFIPEIKGEECLHVLLNHSDVMQENGPIIVPYKKWRSLVSNPKYLYDDINSGRKSATNLIKEHPIILFEPPEFFRYTLSKNFISYIFGGNISQSRKFYSDLRKGRDQSALEIIPDFYRPFVERQMSSIIADAEIERTSDYPRSSHIERGWQDPRIDESYSSHIFEMGSEALKQPNGTIIPPVPPLTKSTAKSDISRIISSNLLASLACEYLSDNSHHNYVSPYFHLYIDSNLAEMRSGRDLNTINYILEKSISDGGKYSGLALTITNYENAFESNLRQLEMIIEDVRSFCHENYLPMILPRSSNFGLYFTDFEVQGYSTLLSGATRYLAPSKGMLPENKFGKTYLIDSCTEHKKSEVETFILQYGEYPKVEGLPSRPTESDLMDDKKYRLFWSKPRRLTQYEEAKRIRKARNQGIISPAKLYLQRSDNVFLNSI